MYRSNPNIHRWSSNTEFLKETAWKRNEVWANNWAYHPGWAVNISTDDLACWNLLLTNGSSSSCCWSNGSCWKQRLFELNSHELLLLQIYRWRRQGGPRRVRWGRRPRRAGEQNEKDKEACEIEPMHWQRSPSPRRRASPIAGQHHCRIWQPYSSWASSQEKRRNGLGAARWEISDGELGRSGSCVLESTGLHLPASAPGCRSFAKPTAHNWWRRVETRENWMWRSRPRRRRRGDDDWWTFAPQALTLRCPF